MPAAIVRDMSRILMLTLIALMLVGEEPPTAEAPLPTIEPPGTLPPPPASIAARPLPARLARLDRMDERERTELLHEVVYERQRVLETLLDRLAKGTPTARCHAAYLLGSLRFEQAVPHLVRVLWLEDAAAERLVLVDGQWQKQTTDVWFWRRWPAAEALIVLGDPALPYLIDLLADEDSPELRRLAAAVILKIAGARAGDLVGDAADREPSERRRSRLTAAVTWFP